MNKHLASGLVATTLLASSGAASAAFFTDETAFLNAISGFATTSTQDFEGTTGVVGTGTAVGDITFTYSFGPHQMAVIDDAGAPTTSGTHFLGTDDGDVFLGGDDFIMDFSVVHAIGLYIISDEVQNDTIYDGDLVLSTSEWDAVLDIDAGVEIGGSGSGTYAYFLGIVDESIGFNSASLTAHPDAVESVTYVVDDIILATKAQDAPLPAALGLLLTGLFGAAFARRRIA